MKVIKKNQGETYQFEFSFEEMFELEQVVFKHHKMIEENNNGESTNGVWINQNFITNTEIETTNRVWNFIKDWWYK